MTTDPEIAAELELRARTERDRKRTRGEHTYGWTAPPIVEQWPCRSGPSCGEKVGVTAEALHALERCNALLRERAEGDLRKSQIVFCERCRERGIAMAGDRNRKASDAIAEVIRELKRHERDTLHERQLIKRLESMGHPDVQGLVDAIARRHTGASSAPRSKSL